MRTLIVPCAGSKKINRLPIYLNRHPDGELLAKKAIEGVNTRNYDRIIYTIMSQDRQYDAERKLMNEVGADYHIEICELSEQTNGPAETVYQALIKSNVIGEVAVRDSTNYISFKNNADGNFIIGLDLTKVQGDILNLRSKSFIVMNEQNQVLDVIEKKFRSDVISVGMYGFESAEDYIFAYEHLNDKNYPIDKLYVSHIMSYLIGYKSRIFHYEEASVFEDWGSLEGYSVLQRDYATCLVDLDALYGENVNELSDKQVNMLFNAAKSTNLSFIMFTSDVAVDRRRIEKLFRSAGINCTHVILLHSKSTVHRYIDSPEQLESVVKGV